MHKFKVELIHPIDADCQNAEFYLHYEGKKYYGWAFAIEGILSCMQKDRLTGESANGLYFYVTDLIIIEKISLDNINKTIDNIIKESPLSLDVVFSRV